MKQADIMGEIAHLEEYTRLLKQAVLDRDHMAFAQQCGRIHGCIDVLFSDLLNGALEP